MKKAILILVTVLAAQAATAAHAEAAPSYTVVLAGGATQNSIHIWLTPDGYSYVIDSAVPLEVGGSVCERVPGLNELKCRAPVVAGFIVNGGGADDLLTVASNISVGVTLRGAGGRDILIGGGGADRMIGGDGNDQLRGGPGDDVVFGGPGDDSLFGGPGDDVLRGGEGADALGGGPGANGIYQDLRPQL
jgi:Ca2+-binding RTX toxin-like protein